MLVLGSRCRLDPDLFELSEDHRWGCFRGGGVNFNMFEHVEHRFVFILLGFRAFWALSSDASCLFCADPAQFYPKRRPGSILGPSFFWKFANDQKSFLIILQIFGILGPIFEFRTIFLRRSRPVSPQTTPWGRVVG